MPMATHGEERCETQIARTQLPRAQTLPVGDSAAVAVGVVAAVVVASVGIGDCH